MEIFNAIGLEIAQGKTIEDLAKNAERCGEASLSMRDGGTIHGRCWHIGFGLEVWTTLYESKNGEVFHADCRPGFRARYRQNIQNWILREDQKEGEAAVEGTIEKSSKRVFFQLQNLTEVSLKKSQHKNLTVGLCGLAYQAEVHSKNETPVWKALSEINPSSPTSKADWHLRGRVLNFSALRNPFSGHDLCWIYIDAGAFHLEILVNQDVLKGEALKIGASIKTDVWLQGHIANPSISIYRYEGVDWSVDTADYWKKFKRLN